MGADRFRERMARVDKVLADRLGDPVEREDGTPVPGFFFSPFGGDLMRGGTHRIGVVSNPDEVTQPKHTVTAAIAQDLPKGAKLIVKLPDSEGGGVYSVMRHKPDGEGLIDLELRYERTGNPA